MNQDLNSNNISDNNQQPNNVSEANNDTVQPSNMSGNPTNEQNDIESLTVDYDNLYNVDNNNNNNNSEEKVKITAGDIQFDNNDYIQDETIIRKQDAKDTKRNLVFMGIVVAILILTILFIFPYIFKIRLN